MKNQQWNMKVVNDLIEMHKCEEDGVDSWRFMVENMDQRSLVCLVEIICNVLAGHLKLRPDQIKELKPHRKNLRGLSRIRCISKARKSLSQTGGGFLAPLIPIILSLAANLLLK